MTELTPEQQARQSWLSLLAKSPAKRLAELFDGQICKPRFEWLQKPEIGAVMVRGRMGGTGAPFNLGEMSITRCALVLETGEVGHGYVQGRNKTHAEIAAVLDALMQTTSASLIRSKIFEPLTTERNTKQSARAGDAAATKVDFFTMVRGED